MKNPSLEIFVLSYNRAEFLQECLNSIVNQTYRDFVLTILDNHSEQDIAIVVNSFHDDRLRLVINETNIGALANIEKAVLLASSEYFIVFHDDDCMSPQMVERQMDLFKIFPNISMVSAGINFVYENRNMSIFKGDDSLRYKIFETPTDLVNGFFFDKEGFSFASIMYRAKFAKQVMLDFERFANIADRPFILGVAKFGPFIRMSNPTYNVRVHPNQDSSTAVTWNLKNEIELARYYLDITNDIQTRLLRQAIIKMLVLCYLGRNPKISLFKWIYSLQEKQIPYWPYLTFLLPYYFFRKKLKMIILTLFSKK